MSVMVVAELSANAAVSPDYAVKITDEAKRIGATHLKVQCYDAESLTLDHDGPGFTISSGSWEGSKLIDLYRDAQTPRSTIEKIAQRCKEIGLPWFASCFDRDTVDFIDGFHPPFHKVASFEIVDIPLIGYMASKGRPLIISTGMASNEEIREAIKAAGDVSVTLLHCISGYPTDAKNYNLKRMEELFELFDLPVGLSDHSLSTTLPAAAVALGAVIIEKHLTYDRMNGGTDAAFSLNPYEFSSMAEGCQEASSAMSSPSETNEEMVYLRRSIYVVKDIKKGEAFTPENVRSIRPGFGLDPVWMPHLMERTASEDISFGSPLTVARIAPKIIEARGAGVRVPWEKFE